MELLRIYYSAHQLSASLESLSSLLLHHNIGGFTDKSTGILPESKAAFFLLFPQVSTLKRQSSHNINSNIFYIIIVVSHNTCVLHF